MSKSGKFEIPIAKPSFFGGEMELIQIALDTGWVTQGPLVSQFESSIAGYVECDQAVAVTSCTTGLHIAMLINGIGAGHEVICPSFSFIATANSIIHSGAQPQFCDIEKDSLNLSPSAVHELIEQKYDHNLINKETGNKLKAILVVHQIGIPADIDRFKQLADQFEITIIEDSACAIGSTYKGSPIGSSGNVGVLSFHPRKVITCGEGGMLLLKDDALAEKARVLREHGASISPLVRHQSQGNLYESYEVVGYNYRMTDLQAALGIKQLEQLDNILNRRAKIAKKYNECFSKLSFLSPYKPADYVTKWNYQSYPIILRSTDENIRDKFMLKLKELGINTRRGIPPIHREPAYKAHSYLNLPNTDDMSKRVIFLPIFAGQTEEEVNYVIENVSSLEKQIDPVFVG